MFYILIWTSSHAQAVSGGIISVPTFLSEMDMVHCEESFGSVSENPDECRNGSIGVSTTFVPTRIMGYHLEF